MITFVDRFRSFSPLSASEESALARLTGPVRRVSRRATIRREGDPVDGFYVLLDGWVASSIISPNGNRFITKIHLPGDLIGSPSMVTDVAAETLFTLTDAVIAPISLSGFATMVNEHPRLGTIFLLDAQFERIELTNRLFTIGRSNAHAAVAGLILDLADRLSERGEMQNGSSFVMHLTQEDIGDATGLTPVHVNRMINGLRRDGILEQVGKVMRLIDRGQLESVAGRKKPARSANMEWLPPSRQ